MPNPRNDFLAFTIKHNGRADRIITDVKITKAFDPAQHPTTPPYPIHNTTALWDTGATKSVITKNTVDAIHLDPVGVANINHAGGSTQSNTYLINVFLPNTVAVIGVLVSECENIAGDFGAIIGMDIMNMGDFAITNVNNETCMTFRIPSIQTIDYVIEANRIKYAGVGRNSPCPCGKTDDSGKRIKFKRCCGMNLQL